MAEKRAQREERVRTASRRKAAALLRKLREPMPRVGNKYNRYGTATEKEFRREFMNRWGTLGLESFQLPPGASKAFDGTEEVDVAEPRLTEGVAPKTYNANCNMHLTASFARSSAPITACAMTGDLRGIELAVESGRYDIDGRDVKGDCAVTLAALHGQSDALELLIELGASLEAVDQKGWSAAHGAAAGKHPNVLRKLHKLGARLDLQDRTGSMPAHYAARFCELDCLKTLLVLAFDTCSHAAQSTGLTPLHQAAACNNAAACELLAGVLGASAANAPDKGGETPLHKAARAGAVDAYRSLVRKGASVHAANLDDETPHALLKGVCVNAAPLDEAPLMHHAVDPPRATFEPSVAHGTAPEMQASKRELQNELHRMRLEARRACAMAEREAQCATENRRQVSAARRQESELKLAAKLDIAIRRDVRLVAEKQHLRAEEKKAKRAAKKKKLEKQRRVAARKAERKRRMAAFKMEQERKKLLLVPSAR